MGAFEHLSQTTQPIFQRGIGANDVPVVLAFLPSPALGPLGLVALVSFAALAVVLSAPVRRAHWAPIGPALAAQ